ncbi:endonuclease/exonuclease/phosphatase family protein [Actinomadura verrucosospora]|uniref:Endonuclease/exonuclease/phosphatase n=1 Tax=Actinomadura verrucosospora TaxID=46165 RepID=A0A7D3VNB1_ACTVE|nr:endonuclease/exonuclease/phosphatase family protein [Actinomadura verrucosospora]QKG18535.1 endonuclease/exonuclease/phosphatase [Actinomadura verrucosospora]
MGYDIEEPYGPLIETTCRVATWNVWDRYGPYKEREAAIIEVLRDAAPDVLVLVEAWEDEDDSLAARLGAALGLPHAVFGGSGSGAVPGARSGVAVLSRWPQGRTGERPLGDPAGGDGGLAVYAEVQGPRGAVHVFGVALGYKLGHSGQRQEQVRGLTAYVRETTGRDAPAVVAGDFNAGPDSDEIRMLTGRAAVGAPGVVFYDAWEMAGDGTPGHTWSNANPWTRPVLWPDRRIDHVFSAWPRAGGAGHPVHCALLGAEPVNGVVASDHYGVLADLRY